MNVIIRRQRNRAGWVAFVYFPQKDRHMVILAAKRERLVAALEWLPVGLEDTFTTESSGIDPP